MAKPQRSKRNICQYSSSKFLPPDIEFLEGRTISIFRVIISFLLSLFTGGFFLLLNRWSVRLYSISWFKPVSLESATHLFIISKTASISPPGSKLTVPCSFSFIRITREQTSTYFVHRGDRCIWSPEEDCFIWIALLSHSFSISEFSSYGLTDEEAELRYSLFGSNSISMVEPSFFSLLLQESLSPLVLFQCASVGLWCLENYFAYAATIAFITFLSVFLSVRASLSTISSLKKLASTDSVFEVRAYRGADGKTPITIDVSGLVPGDLVMLDGGEDTTKLPILPSDGILIHGEVLVDESFLTGESIPIIKTPSEIHEHAIDDTFINNLMSGDSSTRAPTTRMPVSLEKAITLKSKLSSISGDGSISDASMASDSASLLFGGTALLDATEGALYRVTAIGANTLRGRMLKAMRYPPPLSSFAQLHMDALTFMGILGILASIGFIATLSLLKSSSLLALFVRAGDLVTVVLPPALPASLALGTGFALQRLAQKEVICTTAVTSSNGRAISSPINVAGRVDSVIFDKTGTLTEDSLEVLWVSESKHSSHHPGEVRLIQVQNSNISASPLRGALATCHTLRMLNGKLVGDPLDITLFTWSGWSMEYNPRGLAQVVVTSHAISSSSSSSSSSSTADPLKLAVVRVWPFCPILRRTTVIVKRTSSSNSSPLATSSQQQPATLQLFVKGAPEVLVPLCDPASVPASFLDATLPAWTRRGYRVILVAGTILTGITSWVSAQRLTRSEAEMPKERLRFLGAVVLVNSVKKGSWETIARLCRANIAVGMATGDHAITAAAVARQVGIGTDKESPSFDLQQQAAQLDPSIRTVDVLADRIQRPIAILGSSGVWMDEKMIPLENGNKVLPLPVNYFPVVSGSEALGAYLSAVQLANVPVLQLVQVFARLSPDDKKKLVSSISGDGSIVAFCGDGANDVAALQAADVGISLATGSDSLVAPFCSLGADPRCVLDVLIEGRGSLGVSFACFRFMALYSMVQFVAVSLLYLWGQNLSDGQFIWQDLCVILPLATAIARMRPGSVGLSVGRLPGRLVEPQVLVSMLVQIILQLGMLIFLYFIAVHLLHFHPRSSPLTMSNDLSAFEGDSLNSTIFLFSNFQYLLMALLFGAWPPFQQPVYANFLMMTITLSLLLANIFIVLGCDSEIVSYLFGTVALPPLFRVGVILGMVVLDVALSILVDTLMTPFILSIFSFSIRKSSTSNFEGRKLSMPVPSTTSNI